MVKSNTAVMVVAMLVGLVFTSLPCSEAQVPMGAPMMSPGTPMAMAPTTDCLTALTNVSDCLTYVQIGSNMTVPDKPCCPEFAGLLESNPICLCELVAQAKDYNVDINRAQMLPSVCKIEAPPLSACPASPIPAPTSSPTGEAPGPTTGGLAPEGGAALTPGASANGGSNGASSTAVHNLSTLICFVVAIFIAYS